MTASAAAGCFPPMRTTSALAVPSATGDGLRLGKS